MTDPSYPDLRVEDVGRPVAADGTGTFELLSLPTPLLDQAHAHQGKKVIIYVAGGIRVDGKLVAVDDDALVLTVEDPDHAYFVAVESIAVLQVHR